MNKTAIAIIALILLAMLAVDLHLSGTNTEYSIYNTNWNGTSMLADDLRHRDAVFVTDYSMLLSEENSTLLFIEPDGRFTYDEIAALKHYLDNGNTIFISDESGNSNTMLQMLGTGLSIGKANLSSVDNEYSNRRFLIAYPLGNDILLKSVESVALNMPSLANGGDVLMKTGFLTWIDENGNGRADSDEPIGSRPVMVRAGSVYLLADSGIFINALYSDKRLRDNHLLIENILSMNDKILLETRHSAIAADEDILSLLNKLRNNNMIIGTIVILVLLIAAFAIYREKDD